LRADQLREGFAGLMMPERYVRKLLPAINAGRSILLFGPPGNGKTTYACRIAELYSDTVYIPHAVEIAGQIMRVFDPGLHRPMPEPEGPRIVRTGVAARDVDLRWVPCYRPFAMAGGELTLDMLDLQYDPHTRDYTAPLHVKALNGVFLIDDFGRQRMDPKDLLNRWIVPMENRMDFLKLRTGKTFSVPFDDLLIFSTNMEPQELMDPALLRRIPYKMKLYAPTRTEFTALFEVEAKAAGLTITPDVLDFIIKVLAGPTSFGLALFQPRFICQQVREACRAFDLQRRISKELAVEALSNLYVQLEAERDSSGAA
jgi:predicted ATPase with chaperone activity